MPVPVARSVVATKLPNVPDAHHSANISILTNETTHQLKCLSLLDVDRPLKAACFQKTVGKSGQAVIRNVFLTGPWLRAVNNR